MVYLVLVCNFLMTYDVKHLFTSVFDICISSLGRFLFRSFVHFLIGLFVFLFCILRGFCGVFLYNFDTSPLSDMCFANIFSQCVLFSHSFNIYLIY